MDPGFDALLSDICISTSSAPVYFPAHFFKTKDSHGNDREFNLIDGGIAANNPVSSINIYCIQLYFSHVTAETIGKHLKLTFTLLVQHFCFIKALLAMRPTGAKANLLPANVLDYGKYLVLSVGTGTSKSERKYDAVRAAKWGLISWLYKDGNCPLVDAFTFASADMADLHLSLLFNTVGHINNYLRIQVFFSAFYLVTRNYHYSVQLY